MAGTDLTNGASNASDFQPLTRDPQNNVATGLQNTSTSLQPTTTGSTNINQQPSTVGLKVQGTNAVVPNTTKANPTSQPAHAVSGWWLLALAGVALVGMAIVTWAIRKRAVVPAEVVSEPTVESVAELQPSVISQNVAPKPTKKKSSKKKRRSSKKRKR